MDKSEIIDSGRAKYLLNSKINLHDIVIGCIFDKGKERILLVYRKPHIPQGGFWELPGGKIESGENQITALNREMLEELNIKIINPENVGKVFYLYDTKELVQLNIWRIVHYIGILQDNECKGLKWVWLNQLNDVLIAKPNREAIQYCLRT